MPYYRCLVADQRGRTFYREQKAPGEDAASRSFRGTGLTVLSVRHIEARREKGRWGRRSRQRGVLEFTGMMELLLGSGLSLRDALEVLTGGDPRSGAARLGQEIAGAIQKGASFAQAVHRMEDTFPPIYRGLVKVGDLVGSVERIFPRLNAYLGDQKKLREKVSAALAYPALVFAAAVLGTLGLGVFILPKLETIFAGFGGSAGGIQKNLQTLKLLFFILGGIPASAALALGLCKTLGRAYPGIACFLDRRLLGFPGVGAFFRAWESLNFSFAMEVLTGGGVPVETALGEAAALIRNTAYRRALLGIQEKVINGGGLSRAFAGEPVLPPRIGQWLSIGEKSGGSEKVFSQIRCYFQGEVERISGRFLLLIEPALIIIIGLVLLGLVTGIILPLFSMYENLF